MAKAKQFNAAKWVEDEIFDVMTSYGNTRFVASEFVVDLLEEGEYSDELTPEQVRSALPLARKAKADSKPPDEPHAPGDAAMLDEAEAHELLDLPVAPAPAPAPDDVDIDGAWQQHEAPTDWAAAGGAGRRWFPLVGRCPGKLPAAERRRRRREFRGEA